MHRMYFFCKASFYFVLRLAVWVFFEANAVSDCEMDPLADECVHVASVTLQSSCAQRGVGRNLLVLDVIDAQLCSSKSSDLVMQCSCWTEDAFAEYVWMLYSRKCSAVSCLQIFISCLLVCLLF